MHRVLTPRKILFLCQGNICRSPYAEASLQRMLHNQGESKPEVLSAGLCTTPGKEADLTAQQSAKKRGIDLSRHRTRRFEAEDITFDTLLVVMDPLQKKVLSKVCSTVNLRNVVYLGLFNSTPSHPPFIRDPFGGTIDDFNCCYEIIDSAVSGLFALLMEIKTK